MEVMLLQRTNEIESAASAWSRVYLTAKNKTRDAEVSPEVIEDWATFHFDASKRVLDARTPVADVADLCLALESAVALIQKVRQLIGPETIKAVSDVDSLIAGTLIGNDLAALAAHLGDIVAKRPDLFVRPHVTWGRPEWATRYDPKLMTGLRRATPAEAKTFAQMASFALQQRANDLARVTATNYEFYFTNFRAPSEPLRRPTVLYRWYDVDDRLLYIGITEDMPVRVKAHFRKSSWSAFADYRFTVKFADRPLAERAEEAAIRDEQPLFNHQYNDTPEARRRLVEYLIQKGRLDLLAPAVSRG